MAAFNGNAEMTELLLRNGANVNLSSYGTTPLMTAAVRGEKEVVELLLRANANQILQNGENKTALDLARDFNHPAVVQLLERTTCYPSCT